MTTEVRDYISVSEKLKSFGVATPNGFSILPSNLATASDAGELRQYVESDTVRTLFKQHKIDYVEIFDEDSQPSYLEQYSSEWFGPTLFVSASLLSGNPDLLSVALSIISNYLYDLFRGQKNSNASLDVVVQDADGCCKQIHYNGPVDGLNALDKVVKELMGDK